MAVDIKYVKEASLEDFATERQKEYLRATELHGSVLAASKALGVNESTVRRSLSALYTHAASKGYSPQHDMTRTVPAPFRLRGVSTLYNGKGEIAQQWHKTERERGLDDQYVKEWVEALIEDYRGMSPTVPVPLNTLTELLAIYPMGDPHFGMYAWAEETGDDFDLEIAERLTCGIVDILVERMPAAETAILLNLGDFYHADDSRNATPSSGHALDIDTRYEKVMKIGRDVMVRLIRRLREKHKTVIIWNVRGNHDPHASFALSMTLDGVFENDPNVSVCMKPGLYKYFRFGNNLVGAHHGHGAKFEQLGGIMAFDRASDWGDTEHRYWYCGHVHHKNRDKEVPGVMVETFNTLAARDAWHAGKGYRARRDMYGIVLHKDYGEWERHRADVSMVSGS